MHVHVTKPTQSFVIVPSYVMDDSRLFLIMLSVSTSVFNKLISRKSHRSVVQRLRFLWRDKAFGLFIMNRHSPCQWKFYCTPNHLKGHPQIMLHLEVGVSEIVARQGRRLKKCDITRFGKGKKISRSNFSYFEMTIICGNFIF